MTDLMLPGEVAMTLGMTVQGVRALERRGHLHPQRSVGGWRIFDADEVEQVRRARAMRKSVRQPIGPMNR